MRFTLSLICVLSFLFSYSQEPVEKEYKLVFYNVENLFDARNDSLTMDDEFTPDGERHWTNFKVDQKVAKLAQTLVAVGEWNPPAVIGLCEIENRLVLERLVNHPLLKKMQLRIVHKDSPDPRGIDVALLYRKDVFFPEDYNYIPLLNSSGDTIRTREILHVVGTFFGKSRLHIFVNHWPSRYGGLLETEIKREWAAAALKAAIRRVLVFEPGANIVCAGDFNDQPTDESISGVLGAVDPGNVQRADTLVNLSLPWMQLGKGTLKYQQNWFVFDQIIVSRYLLESGSLVVDQQSASVFSSDFLLEKDDKYTGTKPFRTFAGLRFNGGFSDHLPVVLRLKERQPK